MTAMTRFNFLWSDELASRTERYAAENGISKSDVVRWALSEKMASHQSGLQSASVQELIDELRRRQREAPV